MHKKGYYAAQKVLASAVAETNAAERARWETRRAAARAERERLAAMPAVPLEQIKTAKLVMLRDGLGWQALIRVNRNTVTVRKHGLDTRHAHDQVIGVRS